MRGEREREKLESPEPFHTQPPLPSLSLTLTRRLHAAPGDRLQRRGRDMRMIWPGFHCPTALHLCSRFPGLYLRFRGSDRADPGIYGEGRSGALQRARARSSGTGGSGDTGRNVRGKAYPDPREASFTGS